MALSAKMVATATWTKLQRQFLAARSSVTIKMMTEDGVFALISSEPIRKNADVSIWTMSRQRASTCPGG